MFSRLTLRSWSTVSTTVNPRIGIIGAGPAGLYAAQNILKKNSKAQIDVYERLPMPFGLVRFGVAPDHPEVKNVEQTFTKVLENPRVKFVGNVEIGKDIHIQELRNHYDVLLFSYGASLDRELGIKGENSKNVLSAKRFVGYYNGLPEDSDLDVNLDHETAVVIGMGNVAIDVARILLSPIDLLKKTDITEYALEKLSKSRLKKVYIVGRRGPMHVAFTIKELREMVKLPGVASVFDKDDFVGVKEIIPELKRPKKRLIELLYKSAMADPNPDSERSWQLKLLRSPSEIMADVDGNVNGIKLSKTKMVGDRVETTDETEDIECGLVLKSVGYKSEAIDDGIPFDSGRGVIRNEEGRISDGLYCTGWVATGPRGVIVDTMNTSFKVGQTIVQDIESGAIRLESQKSGFDGINGILEDRKVRMVDLNGWRAIDAEEQRRGSVNEKPREKIVDVQAALDVL